MVFDTGMKKKLPVGIDDFEKLRTENFYYVDKTAMIRDLLNNWGEVNLFTRPRRFGKSLNMSMLQAFFEIGTDQTLFDGLEISKETALCEAHMGKHPVISISLKGINALEYETARSLAVRIINEEARRLQYLLESDKLSENDKTAFSLLLKTEMDDGTLICSLRIFSELLYKHYEKKTIILIDEYDVPLAKANENGYYDQMIILIRNMFEQTLKTNKSLHFAVLTGCLRVVKESIFTGLNNLRVFSISTVGFDEYFGFTDEEVKEMLVYYGFIDKYAAMKEWYDGYQFGNMEVYCPWDVINYCYELRMNPLAEPEEYWSNTSSNEIIRRFIQKADTGKTKSEIEALVAGETVTKKVREDMTYNHLYDSIDNIWSVLFATGYLTQRGRSVEGVSKLTIPNKEIRNIFTEQIMEMFKLEIARDGERLQAFCEALQTGDAVGVEKQLTAYLGRTISIRDTYTRKEKKENFFHGIILGILGFKDDWMVFSNEESGDGYSDIIIEIENEDIGIIIEVKYAENARFDAALKEAAKQIEVMNYTAKLRNEGYRIIYKYGIACFKKKCRVSCEMEVLEPEEDDIF